MPKTTGARYFAEVMKGYGITHAFFVPTILMEALAEMDELGIQKILTHGEKAAAYMADGYARAANRPGLCMGQQIGASNLAAGLRDGYMAGSPIIAITGAGRSASHSIPCPCEPRSLRCTGPGAPLVTARNSCRIKSGRRDTSSSCRLSLVVESNCEKSSTS